MQMMLPTVFWTPKSVLKKIPWVSKLLGMSTTTGGASTIEIMLSMEMSRQHTPWKGFFKMRKEKKRAHTSSPAGRLHGFLSM